MIDPIRPYARGSATSREAAEAAAVTAPTVRLQVLAYIEGQGLAGATDQEVMVGLRMSGNTVRPRRTELVRAGAVVDSGQTRATTSGRRATVWRVRRPGEDAEAPRPARAQRRAAAPAPANGPPLVEPVSEDDLEAAREAVAILAELEAQLFAPSALRRRARACRDALRATVVRWTPK